MAKHKAKHKRKRRRRDDDEDDSDGNSDAEQCRSRQLFKYAASGRASKLRKLLKDHPGLVNKVQAADATTPLHQVGTYAA